VQLYASTYSRFDVYDVEQPIQIQSLKTIPEIGVPHVPQKRCNSNLFMNNSHIKLLYALIKATLNQ